MPSKSPKPQNEEYTKMATEEFNNSFIALLKTRTPLIYISTNEEERLLSYIASVVISRGYIAVEWDCVRFFTKVPSGDKIEAVVVGGGDLRYPEPTLTYVIDQIEKKMKTKEDNNGTVYVLCDFYRYLSPERCSPQVERLLKHIARLKSNCAVILTGPSYISNTALEKEIATLDFPFPNEEEIKSILKEIVGSEKVQTGFPNIAKKCADHQEEIVNSVKGLTTREAHYAYAKSIVMAKDLKVSPLDINVILQEKKQIIKKTDILEYVDSDIDIKDVGGLDNLVRWLDMRKVAFTKEAKDYGLKPPRGVLLLGMPGCGKSLVAKAAATLYETPLLRLDFGKMFNSLVGESEKIARHAIKLAENIAPCVSGESIVIDCNGKSNKVKDLFEVNEPFYTYALNEETWKMEKTKVSAVIRQPLKKKMLSLKTSIGSVEVTEDHRMMVNRNGELMWVKAGELLMTDLLVTPKKLQVDKRSLNMKKLFPSKEDNVTATFGNIEYSANIKQSKRTLKQLAIIAGMIDAIGCIDEATGDILLSSKDIRLVHYFACTLSEAFLTEPAIRDDMVILNNMIIVKVIKEFISTLCNQDEDVISYYLSGYFHAAGTAGFADANLKKPTKPFVSLKVITDGVFNRLKSALNTKGIIPFKVDTSCMIVNKNYIYKFLDSVPILTKNKAVSLFNFMKLFEKVLSSNIEITGYQLGSVLAKTRKELGIRDIEYGKSDFIEFEKPNTFINEDAAIDFHSFLKENYSDDSMQSLNKLLESDVVGVKIDSISDAGIQWAYDLACEKNHNFFANGFLCHNCILWADEIEKGLAGGVGAGSGDSGTTKRVIGTFLTWLQEKQAPVFVICTANNVDDIPPEFMRAGRFDEVFFVDLPSAKGRYQIFEVLLKRFKYDPATFDLDALAGQTSGYSGAEIEKVIENAMFECFCNGKKPVGTTDLLLSCHSISPLSVTRSESFDKMRKWSEGRCKSANTKDANIENYKKASGNNDLDI